MKRLGNLPANPAPGLRAAPTLILLLALAVCGQVGVAQPVVYWGASSTIRVINADGTGDRALPFSLPDQGYPSFSKDGRYLTLTAQEEGRPDQYSRNVFLMDLVTGQSRQITSFEDQVTQDDFIVVWPRYHALSPDDSRVAILGQAKFLNFSVPMLRIFRVEDGFPLDIVFTNRVRTGYTQGGDGVDWHPSQDLLVYSADIDVPQYDPYTNLRNGDGEGAAIFVSPQSAEALYFVNGLPAGVAEQLSHPVAYGYIGPTGGWFGGQSDYAPAFSPDGQKVAYVRAGYWSEWIVNTYVSQPSRLSLRVVNRDGTNDHEILALPEGVYVTHLSWSADGTRLVFDAGQQPVSGTMTPLNLVIPETDALWMINADGTDLHSLCAAPSGFPVWAPSGATFCNLPGVVTPGGAPGTINYVGPPLQVSASRTPGGPLRLDIRGGVKNMLLRVRASTDLANWQPIGSVWKTDDTPHFTDNDAATLPRRFYQVWFGGE